MVRTRIAPSPTGEDIHIGNLYTALINWTIARKNDGKFIVRIEDTDRTRYVEGAEQKILNSLQKYGLLNDEGTNVGGEYGPYRQSERLELYKKHALELVEKGHAYFCFCTKERLDELRKSMIAEKKIPKYDKHCLRLSKEEIDANLENEVPHVIRLNVPVNKDITFNDLIRGDITINSDQIDDQVLLKSDGFPTYHLAVVIDDVDMKISHIIRAEEWISSTPKHVLLYDAFGWEKPIFSHLPILRNPDKSKLSKRKNPVWASWYLEQGYLPEAVLNYLANMGWSHPEQKEIFSIEEFIKTFRLEDISPVGPAFDKVKLEWMNGMYIRALTHEQLYEKIMEFIGADYDADLVKKTIPLVQERIKTLGEYLPMCEFIFTAPEEYEVPLTEHKEVLIQVATVLESINEWNTKEIGDAMVALASSVGMKNGPFFALLRVAITGKKISPPLNESMEILGQKECVKRIRSVSK
jgi:glutamyl-tRNA synthetase